MRYPRIFRLCGLLAVFGGACASILPSKPTPTHAHPCVTTAEAILAYNHDFDTVMSVLGYALPSGAEGERILYQTSLAIEDLAKRDKEIEALAERCLAVPSNP